MDTFLKVLGVVLRALVLTTAILCLLAVLVSLGSL